MPLRKKGTLLKGPLKNWNSLGVSRSLVIESVIGQMRTWKEMGIAGLRIDARMVTATANCPAYGC
jgi:hypothetical protein